MSQHITRQSSFGLLFIVFIWACQKSTSRETGAAPRNGDTTQTQTTPTTKDTGVCIGNSIIAGHPWAHSPLEVGNLNKPDSPGQIDYQLTQLTKFPWINRGWGGQFTTQIRKRFLRDAIGLSDDPGDGMGPRTLNSTPTYVVLEGGINDIYYKLPMDSTKANMIWMASKCKQYNIKCIVLNSVGQGNAALDQPGLDSVTAFNKWLATGALDTTNAIIVDINSLWNSGTYGGVSAYGNDNAHYSSLVYNGDGIHFTIAGYDSVANAIFRVAKLP